MLDPGIGFGKTVAHNLELLRPPRRADDARAARSWSAPRARASSAASSRDAAGERRAGWRRRGGCRARSPRTCSRSSAARACSACTTSRRCATRWRWRLLRWAGDGRRGAGDDADELDDDGDGSTRIARRRAESVTIEITGLSLYTHHGVSEAEREVGQRLVLDLRLDIGETDATVTDSIEDTVDYAEVCQLVALIAQQRSHKTLERLCSTIADRLLADYDARGRVGEGGQARAADRAERRRGLRRGLARSGEAERGELSAAAARSARRSSAGTSTPSRELLAPDIVFHSPVTFHPFVGRDTVAQLLGAGGADVRGLPLHRRARADGAHALIFRASVAGREIEGIDLLRFDEHGLIADFTVMLRPLSGLIPFAQAMGEKAHGRGPADDALLTRVRDAPLAASGR